jgi:tRNA (guanine-N7-)-methyltransferase
MPRRGEEGKKMNKPEPGHIRSYGRRRGRTLRAGQQELLDTWLPTLVIPETPPGPLDPATLFGVRRAQLWLEIGFGAGEHLAMQAAAHPEFGFIGCEPFVNGVAALLSAVRARRLTNVRIWSGDVRDLLPRLAPMALNRVIILFPDPWPKSRHHKRRLIRDDFLDALARAMAPGAELRLATDHGGYLAYMLERLTRHPAFAWRAVEPLNWRERPADQPETRYERKAVRAGRRPVYLGFLRR